MMDESSERLGSASLDLDMENRYLLKGQAVVVEGISWLIQ